MNVGVSIQTIADNATPAIQEKMAKCRPERIARHVLVRTREHWRDHLAAMPRNKNGYPSTGFWEGAARSVERDSYSAGPLVVLRGSGPPGRPGLAQRYYGGPIEATNHKNITIPICAEAYGTTVKDWGFENLTLVILADGRKFYALYLASQAAQKAYSRVTASRKGGLKSHAAEVSSRRAQKYGSSFASHPKVIMFKGSSGNATKRTFELKFLFKLQPSVDQEGNEDVVPDGLGDVAADAIVEAVE